MKVYRLLVYEGDEAKIIEALNEVHTWVKGKQELPRYTITEMFLREYEPHDDISVDPYYKDAEPPEGVIR